MELVSRIRAKARLGILSGDRVTVIGSTTEVDVASSEGTIEVQQANTKEVRRLEVSQGKLRRKRTTALLL